MGSNEAQKFRRWQPPLTIIWYNWSLRVLPPFNLPRSQPFLQRYICVAISISSDGIWPHACQSMKGILTHGPTPWHNPDPKHSAGTGKGDGQPRRASDSTRKLTLTIYLFKATVLYLVQRKRGADQGSNWRGGPSFDIPQRGRDDDSRIEWYVGTGCMITGWKKNLKFSSSGGPDGR